MDNEAKVIDKILENPLEKLEDESKVEKTSDIHKLPIEKYKKEIIEKIKENPSSIIVGETGSGKSTCIPEFLLEEFEDKRIAILQPRRVAATSLARFVASKRKQRVGEDVGYQIRFDDSTESSTRATFMTDGILLRKIQNDTDLDEYDVVMVDEAHERSLNIDFSLGLLKKIQARRKEKGKKELKIIVASATIEQKKFSDFFEEAPVVEVPGRLHKVDVVYKKYHVENYTERAGEKVKTIVDDGKEGDILIFMPGEAEIKRTIEYIKKFIPNYSDSLEIMPLFGSMAPEDQDKIFAPNSKRKVIIATNIAETSITIDGVRFVIDSGCIKQKNLNNDTGIEELKVQEHAQSGCEQRKGRAGRTAPGTCYRLYTENEFENRQKFQTPEIIRSNLDHVVLHMKSIGIDDVVNFDFVDKPKPESILQAINRLKILGALDENEKLTKDGEFMAELPLKPEMSKMVVEAQKHGCVASICTISAMINDKPLFVRPKGKESEADEAHRKFKSNSGDSDFICLLNVWKEWVRSGFDTRNWPKDNFINWRQLIEIREIRNQLTQVLSDNNIAFENINDDPEAIEKCITAGLIQNLLISSGQHGYRKVFNGNSNGNVVLQEEIFIHPGSTAFSSYEELIIGLDIVTTTRTFARKCQPVKIEWLLEEFPQMFESLGGKKVAYDPVTDSVVEKEVFVFKHNKIDRFGQKQISVEKNYPVSDEVAKEVFLSALIDGKIYFSSQYENETVINQAREWAFRSSGQISGPNIRSWYASRIGNIKSARELSEVADKLKMQLSDLIPLDKIEEINKNYPDHFDFNGQKIDILYKFERGYTGPYSEEKGKDKLIAEIYIPNRSLLEIKSSDIPIIGINGNTEIIFKTIPSGDWKTVEASDLETLRRIDRERKEEIDRIKSRSELSSPYSPYSSTYSSSRINVKPFESYVSDQENKVESKMTSLGDALSKVAEDELGKESKTELGNKSVEEKIEISEVPKPKVEVQKEIMTEEIRIDFIKQLAKIPLLIDFIKKAPELKERDRNKDKLDKAKARVVDLRRENNALIREIAESDNVESIRGKVNEMVKKVERTVKEVARIIMIREDFTERFDEFMTEAEKLCKDQEIPVNDKMLSKIRPEVLKLAMEDGELKNPTSRLEEIIYGAV